ncbi:uncharacterized protein M6B38_327390 [Iris pallida]|uniref:PWWP domain-containing protein n=1 Tax=Iris pallida TaxID=29817 RepID=A0AAX6H705_IRIPA|nr:uncharacterized protein M6B38_327390 [Iris pallida]
MISVATSFDHDRKPSSFLPMEIPRVSSAASPDPESRDSESIDLSLSVHGFKTGDMVWGKVKSHPWWPGLIYNEALATPSVRRSRQVGHVLVAFFGDSSYGWFDPSELIPFAPNFPEKSKQTTLRSFLVAVEEAVDEFSRRGALGLTCNCRNPKNFRPRKVPRYFAVDVPGFRARGDLLR